MIRRYVTDTNCIIWYFYEVFEQPRSLSSRASGIMSEALSRTPRDVRLSIPSVVFLEVFDKWLREEELAAKFHYQVFLPILESPNIEIKPIEREVLEALVTVGGILTNHDVHDKIIVASAIMLECPLITIDPKITQFARDHPAIPSVIA